MNSRKARIAHGFLHWMTSLLRIRSGRCAGSPRLQPLRAARYSLLWYSATEKARPPAEWSNRTRYTLSNTVSAHRQIS